MFFRENRPSLKRASFGYQMRTNDLRVFRYREDKRDTDVIRVSEKQDEKIVSSALGVSDQDRRRVGRSGRSAWPTRRSMTCSGGCRSSS